VGVIVGEDVAVTVVETGGVALEVAVGVLVEVSPRLGVALGVAELVVVAVGVLVAGPSAGSTITIPWNCGSLVRKYE
jgi:hypothetical protein